MEERRTRRTDGRGRRRTRVVALLCGALAAAAVAGSARGDVPAASQLTGNTEALLLTPHAGVGVFTTTCGMWQTDGTPAGTVPSAFRSFGLTDDQRLFFTPDNLAGGGLVGVAPVTALGNAYYFGRGNALWRTDGTTAQTAQVAVVTSTPGTAQLGTMHAVGKVLYFAAIDDATHAVALWRTDGTATGTKKVADLPGGAAGTVTGMTDHNGILYIGDAGLWRSDGTAQGTTQVWKSAASGPPVWFAGKVVWGAADGLMASDGTAKGTTGLFGSLHLTYTDHLTLSGTQLAFTAVGASGSEIWSTDGTLANTKRLAVPGNGPRGDSALADLTFAGARVAFTFNDGQHGREVWITDDTPRGAHLVADIAPGGDGSRPGNLTAVGDVLLFTASAGAGQPATVWRAPGLASGALVLLPAPPSCVAPAPPAADTSGAGGAGSASPPATTDGTPAPVVVGSDVVTTPLASRARLLSLLARRASVSRAGRATLGRATCPPVCGTLTLSAAQLVVHGKRRKLGRHLGAGRLVISGRARPLVLTLTPAARRALRAHRRLTTRLTITLRAGGATRSASVTVVLRAGR